MAKKRSTSTIKRSRTRSGCLTCRDRHVKCDEQQPVCKNCIKSKRKCYRGIRLNFTQYTIYNPDQNNNNEISFNEDGNSKGLNNQDKIDNIKLGDRTAVEKINDNVNAIDNLNSRMMKSFRLLDQSITIASLYKNGRKSYEPFIHLHSPEDLKESDSQYQKDLYCSLPSFTSNFTTNENVPNNKAWEKSWTLPFERFTHHATDRLENPYFKTILENHEITNYLLNDSKTNFVDNSTTSTTPYNVTNSNMIEPLPNISNPFVNLNKPIQSFVDISKYNIDINRFISLIQNQKYFWILDLFNDLNIWKLIIPNYCLKLTELSIVNNTNPDINYDELFYGSTKSENNTSSISPDINPDENSSNKLLIDCLLNCSVDNLSNDLTPILEHQLSYWYEVRNLEVNMETFTKFERLLITIVLVLLHHLIKLEKNFPINKNSILAINNQIKIFNKLMLKLNPSSDIRNKTFKSVIFISCIHSVTILKFLILKQLNRIEQQNNDPHSFSIDQFGPHDHDPLHDDSQYIEDINEEISYNLTYLINQNKSFVNELKSLSKFELHYLNSSYKTLNIAQLNFNYDTSPFPPFPQAPQLLLSKYSSSNFDILPSNVDPKMQSRNSTATTVTMHSNSSYSNDALSSLSSTAISPTGSNSDQGLPRYKSDAFKLREHIWHLLKLDYCTKYPNSHLIELAPNVIDPNLDDAISTSVHRDIIKSGSTHQPLVQNKPLGSESIQPQTIQDTISQEDISISSSSGQIILPNDRGIATIILTQYINKLANIGDQSIKDVSNSNIRTIFQLVNNSMIDQDIKDHWNESFSWAFND